MTRRIRFGAFVREVTANYDALSYNRVTPRPQRDIHGNPAIYRAPRWRLRGIDIYRILMPYVSVRLADQLRAVAPLSLYLVLFQLLILRSGVAGIGVITLGLIAVVIGLMLFMEGLRVGLMPFGEALGNSLPAKATLPVVLGIALLLGVGVTFAEPAIGALKAAGRMVRVDSAPYLYALLNDWAEVLVLIVGLGVGMAAVVGTLRFFYDWPLKPLIYLTLAPTLLLAVWIGLDPQLNTLLGLAWDCGAVTTGPVTVPLMLSLGIGIASAAGKGGSALSGFGIVTLASLFPILGVEALIVVISLTTDTQEIIQSAAQAGAIAAAPGWMARTPWAEIINGLRAIVPLVLFLVLVLHYVLRESLAHRSRIVYGIVLCLLGMMLFNLGLTYGLIKLGSQSGGLAPAAFAAVDTVSASPLYGPVLGFTIALGFAWMLGFGATLAEPALNALGLTVENLTSGALRKSTLIYTVSVGVGCGIALGVVKIVCDWPIVYLLVPSYALALLLTWRSSEQFVNVAWDSAGVTTGPVTVPLVLSMGLGFGNAVNAVEGFGVLAMASVGPIISVMTMGLWVQWKVARKQRRYDVKTLDAVTLKSALKRS